VVQGVAHNIGFGKSIVENEAFIRGDYSTAFIPTYYPEGYHGDKLSIDDKHNIAIAAFKMKNEKLMQNGQPNSEKELYVTIPGKDSDQDFKVVCDGNTFTVTEVATNQSSVHTLSGFNFEHYSLLELQ